jgi:hypothetical protein
MASIRLVACEKSITMAETAEQPGPEQDEQYGSFETNEGETVVYDRDRPTAWVQTDTLVQV